MNIQNNVSPQFKATTVINSEKPLLSIKEIKELSQIGQKIGIDSDLITFSVRHQGDNIGISHKAKFSVGENILEQQQAKIMAHNNIKPFEYIKNKMEEFKQIYKNLAN